MTRASHWERRLYLSAHPFAYPLLRGLDRLGAAVRVPGVGVVVNDPETARAVLLDGEVFRKDGPGSPGDLWTPILGPSVLLNMEGEAHRALRRKLAELFTPASTAALCARVLAEPLRELSARLEGGEPVDLVDTMRVMAGGVICEVIGLPDIDERACRAMFEAGERIVSMVGLRTRTLGPAQVAVAREVLDPIGETAARAFRAGDERTVMGRMRSLGLSEGEARGAAGAFFLTGTETVATLVPRLVALLHDTGLLARVAADRALLDPAIDEAMRVTTPTPVMLRSVHADAKVGRVRVRPGDRVLIATHNCCRSLGPFALEPSPAKAALRRLWFGAGPHFCLGYPLAHAEIHAVMTTLLDHAPLTITSRTPAKNVLIPTYASLTLHRAPDAVPGTEAEPAGETTRGGAA
ncbi:cytochrome P450 [Actinocorallia sp. API 0066]|uniref:cytochrome P450 n=1 Tax=Actinocorallia sp. API 0066 TaxID=2896846 RepID=UPI001E3C13F3|nr:cytochrome P450 [Actinocorallia sp. API 0066]MCD0448212.1 cytochrome P450 [Actinocorallia sp. API 0066]